MQPPSRLAPKIEKPRQAGVGRFRNCALHVEMKDRLRRSSTSLGQTPPT
jgi:hypothetical protein